MKTKLETKDGLFRGDFGHVQMIEAKDITETGEFEGLGAVFNDIDNGGDLILPGAFRDSLNRMPGTMVKMLWQHDPREVIGVYTDVRETETGLYVKGRLLLNIQRAREVHELLKERAIEGLSIGYRTREAHRDPETGVRLLKRVDLWECSVVTFPMQTGAGVTLVKQDGTMPTERDCETHLRDAGLSRNQAKAFVAGGYKALTNLRDAGAGDTKEDQDGLSKLLRDAAAMFSA